MSKSRRRCRRRTLRRDPPLSPYCLPSLSSEDHKRRKKTVGPHFLNPYTALVHALTEPVLTCTVQ